MEKNQIDKLRKLKTIHYVLIALFGLVFVLNKEIFRPNYSHLIVIGILIDCIPNFIGGFVFSLLFFFISLKYDKYKGRIIFYLASLTVLSLLIKEEFFPYFSASKTFDIYDIIASIIGIIAAILFYESSIKYFYK